jgi:hypothetical protein
MFLFGSQPWILPNSYSPTLTWPNEDLSNQSIHRQSRSRKKQVRANLPTPSSVHSSLNSANKNGKTSTHATPPKASSTLPNQLQAAIQSAALAMKKLPRTNCGYAISCAEVHALLKRGQGLKMHVAVTMLVVCSSTRMMSKCTKGLMPTGSHWRVWIRLLGWSTWTPISLLIFRSLSSEYTFAVLKRCQQIVLHCYDAKLLYIYITSCATKLPVIEYSTSGRTVHSFQAARHVFLAPLQFLHP